MHKICLNITKILDSMDIGLYLEHCTLHSLYFSDF